MRRTPDDVYDEWLVECCRSADATASSAAFERLVARWHDRLWHHARRLTNRADAASDVSQESWLAIARGIGRLDDVAAFRGWALRIVTHKAADWIRREQRQRRLRAEVAAATPDPATHTHAHTHDTTPPGGGAGLQAALGALSAGHRAVVSLFYVENLPVEEIATILDVPAGTVKSRLFHARRLLRDALERRMRRAE
ncbi:MAG: RNA polymerase sigma factor [Planctomycetota bacterium]